MKGLILFFALISHTTYGQFSEYSKGYERGYHFGYCQDGLGCISPVAPVAPIPMSGSYSYEDGFSKGSIDGNKAKNTSSKGTTIQEPNLREPVKPIRYDNETQKLINSLNDVQEARAARRAEDRRQYNEAREYVIGSSCSGQSTNLNIMILNTQDYVLDKIDQYFNELTSAKLHRDDFVSITNNIKYAYKRHVNDAYMLQKSLAQKLSLLKESDSLSRALINEFEQEVVGSGVRYVVYRQKRTRREFGYNRQTKLFYTKNGYTVSDFVSKLSEIVDKYNNTKTSRDNSTIHSRNTNIVATVKIGRLEVMTEDLGQMKWDEALKACADLGGGWRLPTKDELNVLYENKDEIGGFAYDYYWSSTEYGNYDAWAQGFTNGNQYYDSKNLNGLVRSVRAF